MKVYFTATGANKSELSLGRIQDKEKQGNYMCMVSVPNSDVNCQSNIASLHITTTTYKPCMLSRKLLNILRLVCRSYFFTPFLHKQCQCLIMNFTTRNGILLIVLITGIDENSLKKFKVKILARLKFNILPLKLSIKF